MRVAWFYALFQFVCFGGFLRIMEGIDAEVLISLVEPKPVLWDKTLDIYKDRIATRKAWEEVCLALKPDFESISDTEKNAFGKYFLLNIIF